MHHKTRVLDLRGENCPEPVVKVARQLEHAVSGEVIHVLTDNEECVRYLMDLIKVTGVGKAEVINKGSHHELVITVE